MCGLIKPAVTENVPPSPAGLACNATVTANKHRRPDVTRLKRGMGESFLLRSYMLT